MPSTRGGYPRRVLIVDDDDNAVALVRTMLASDERIEVVGRARDGCEALTVAEALDPDVVLMDLQMPVMDGIEATRRLRQQAVGARIVVLTGVKDVRRIRDAQEAGADAFVTKIPSPEALAAVVLEENADP